MMLCPKYRPWILKNDFFILASRYSIEHCLSYLFSNLYDLSFLKQVFLTTIFIILVFLNR